METKQRTPAGQRIIFTGPDGIGDYRPRSNWPPYVEVGALTPEATSNLSYLWRAAPHSHPPLPKQAYVGEVGWCWQYSSILNDSTLHSGMQIKKSLIRMEAEDRASHKFLQQSKKTETQKRQSRV